MAAFSSLSRSDASPPPLRLDSVFRTCRWPALVLVGTFLAGLAFAWLGSVSTGRNLAKARAELDSLRGEKLRGQPVAVVDALPAVAPPTQLLTLPNSAPNLAKLDASKPTSYTKPTARTSAPAASQSEPPDAMSSAPAPSAENQLAALQLELQRREEEIARMQAALLSAQRTAEETRVVQAGQMDSMAQKLGVKEKEYSHVRMVAEDVLFQADREFALVQEENVRLRCRLSQLESDNQTLAHRNQALQNEVASCQSQIASLHSEIQQLRHETSQHHGAEDGGNHDGKPGGNGHNSPPGGNTSPPPGGSGSNGSGPPGRGGNRP